MENFSGESETALLAQIEVYVLQAEYHHGRDPACRATDQTWADCDFATMR